MYYKQNQNDGTRFGTHHVSLLSHVCQDKAQHTDFQDGWKFSKNRFGKLTSYCVGNKQTTCDKRCKTGLLVAAYSGTRVPKITKYVPNSDYM